ncbi:MAG: MBL fold metallo-hydrolase, partial [Mollicutes bacterium]|nr:MBL fold metallo-hydrolase [Mollicutes bacterium]
MYIVEVDQDIFIFDAGLKYADDKMLGIDYIIPNYDYLKENKERIVGMFITHGHDEHMGAIADILVDIPNIPVYATSFTLEIIKNDLIDAGIPTENLKLIKPHRKIKFGKNSIFPISLT